MTVPLWDTDGMREVTDAANALDSKWHEPTKPITADPWLQQTQELRTAAREAVVGG